MTKIELIDSILQKGGTSQLCDLLRGLSPYRDEGAVIKEDSLPSVQLTKLVAAARSHLSFITKYGAERNHIIESDGAHYFADQGKFDEWLRAEAPGVSMTELERLHQALN